MRQRRYLPGAYRAEQLRLLVAVTAAAPINDLVLNHLQAHVDRTLEENVQVLKSNVSEMCAVEAAKGSLRRVSRA